MAFVRFTDPDGNDVWIEPRWVTKVRAPIPGRHPGNSKALIITGQTEQAVREEVRVVLNLLESDPPNA